MTVTRMYRLALYLLPVELRRKHGATMEALFLRELASASARGGLAGALAWAEGVGDVVRRAAYEQVRPNREAAHLNGAPMPPITTGQLLRRHAVTFIMTFVALTAPLLFLFARNTIVPAMGAYGASSGAMAEAVLLAVPFTAALTIPMAVLLTVLREFSRLGADGALAAACGVRHGARRLVLPVVTAAVGVAVIAFVVTAEIVPRTNQRLAAALAGGAAAPNDRTMTIDRLRDAARAVRFASEPVARTRARAAAYEVEVQKKLALPAACVIMALIGMVVAFRIPRGGVGLVVGTSLVVFGAYYVLMMTGEDLAERLVVSPFVGMWAANALLTTAALLAIWQIRSPRAPNSTDPVVIHS